MKTGFLETFNHRGAARTDLNDDIDAFIPQTAQGICEDLVVGLVYLDANDSGKLSSQLGESAFQPVAMVGFYGVGKSLDNTGFVIADDGKNQVRKHVYSYFQDNLGRGSQYSAILTDPTSSGVQFVLIIPPEKIEPGILENILESYIAREGTDYGETELSMQDKLNILRPQVEKGEVLIVYDDDSESLTLMTKKDYRASSMVNDSE